MVGEGVPFGTTQPPPCRRGRFRVFRGTKPKQERNKTMKLQEALRGMKVKNWEMRVNDRGRRVV